ncbi:hypothetical protein REPUB_Repub03eG0252800 [Reevesia pubescens]
MGLQADKDKGGFRASSFILVFAGLENMGFTANMVSMVLYFSMVMYFNLASSANTLTNFMGGAYLLTLVGGLISDTFLTKFKTILLFGFIEVLGLALLTIQAYSKDLHPSNCGKSSCVKGGIAVMFYASLSLLALGSGGLRGALSAFGGDQFDENDPKEAKGLASFFNWQLMSGTFGAIVGVTALVYVSTGLHHWYLGFLISAVATFIGFVILAFGKPFYRLQQPKPANSPIVRVAQVIVAAFNNRRLALPENPDELFEIREKENDSREEIISHTNQFRCLDKAAIVPNDSRPTPWTLCTVTQVEEVKIIARMLPILGSTIILNTCVAQLQTFTIEQGYVMDRHLGKFEVPASSIPVIPMFFVTLLVPFYEFLFVPFARKITHHPSGITQLQRAGVGLVLSFISMVIAGFVEVKRKNQANKDITKPISLFWLSFPCAIFGIADVFNLVGLLELYYKEAPVGMRSLSTSFMWLAQSFGYFLSSVFVNVINSVTKRISPSKQGWLHGFDLNKNNLDLFYWFLAIVSFLNFLNYLYWASWYKYRTKELDHPGAKVKDLNTGSLLAEAETTLEHGATETK